MVVMRVCRVGGDGVLVSKKKKLRTREEIVATSFRVMGYAPEILCNHAPPTIVFCTVVLRSVTDRDRNYPGSISPSHSVVRVYCRGQ